MRMRIGYIAPGYNLWRQTVPGVEKKTCAQVEAFNRAGFEAKLVPVESDGSFFTKLKRRIPFMSDGFQWDKVDVDPFDVLYIRRPNYVSKEFLAFLQMAKRGERQIIYEIPTYPYDQERKNLKGFPVHIRDVMHRKKLVNYVDRIADLSGHDYIWGIPTIQIINGIDLEKMQTRNPSQNNSCINIVCTASFDTWHGIDRMIEGLHIFFSKEGRKPQDVQLHLVGLGPESSRLERMVADKGLEDHVVFHGLCDEGEIGEIFDECTLAIECLGCHRKGLSLSSSLKSREYLAKGLPFIYSGKIDVFEEDQVDFCMQVPASEAPIEVEKVVQFHNALYDKEMEDGLIDRIRAYAEEHVSIERTMSGVIAYLNRLNEEKHG